METKKTLKSKKVGLIFGRKIDDIKSAIIELKRKGYEPVLFGWEGYDVDSIESYTQSLPPADGMDCINLFLSAKDFAFKKIGKKTIGAVANCHTIPVIWDWDLTNKQWENLFDFEAQRDYVDDIVQRRYKTLYGTKDTNI